MLTNSLKLNDDKSEFIIFGSDEHIVKKFCTIVLVKILNLTSYPYVGVWNFFSNFGLILGVYNIGQIFKNRYMQGYLIIEFHLSSAGGYCLLGD